MAIDITSLYPGRVNPADSNYPYGSIKNKSPGADDGTPLDADWGNDIWGFLQSLLNAASITPNGVVERVGSSQYLNALRAMGLRSANNSQAGVVELATDGETQAGDDATRAVTPAALSSRTATTGRTGLIELATAAESQGFADAVRALTPKTLYEGLRGSNQSLVASGFQRYPGGIIIQWGHSGNLTVASNGFQNATLTLPIAFPNAMRGHLVTANYGSNDTPIAAFVSGNTTSITGRLANPWQSQLVGSFDYFVIGH